MMICSSLKRVMVRKMAEYGTMLDAELTPAKRKIRKLVSDYFGDPVCVKIRNTPGGNSVFACRAAYDLKESRYLLVIAEGEDVPIGTHKKLSDVKWRSFQARELREDIRCPGFQYKGRATEPFNSRLFLNHRESGMTVYDNREFGFQVALLHKDKKSEFEYPDFGTFATAMETFQALVMIEA